MKTELADANGLDLSKNKDLKKLQKLIKRELNAIGNSAEKTARQLYGFRHYDERQAEERRANLRKNRRKSSNAIRSKRTSVIKWVETPEE